MGKKLTSESKEFDSNQKQQNSASAAKRSNKSERSSKPKRNSRSKDRNFRKPAPGTEAPNANRVSDPANLARNDPKWYYTNAGVTDNALRINFEEFVGQPYFVTDNTKFSPLNVLTYFMQPTPNRSSSTGTNGTADDPGALWAARKLYSALSSVTGRTSNYTPNTLVFLFYALGEMLSMYSFIRRVFAYYRTFNRRNWGIPKSLFTAMCVDYDDFQRNIANYLTEFNTIIVDMNKIPIIQSVAYFQKCVGMYDNIFADMNADMAQLYMMCPATTWYLREDGSSIYPNVSGTVLETVNVCLTTNTTSSIGKLDPSSRPLSAYLSILQQQLQYLMESSTLNIVYSDVLNYSQKNGVQILTIPQISIDYSLGVIYNAVINQQMHHAMQMGENINISGAQTSNEGFAFFDCRNVTGEATRYGYTQRNDVVEYGLGYTYYPITRIPFSCDIADLTTDYWDPEILSALLYDADYMDESLDERVEYTRYMVDRWRIMLSTETGNDANIFSYSTSGDHSIYSEWMVFAESGAADTFALSQVPAMYIPSDMRSLVRMQAIALPPLTWALNHVARGAGKTGYELAGPVGDLKNVTFINPTMLRAANKLIERDLLEVRDLKGFSG